MPYHYIKKSSIVCKWLPILAVLTLSAVPILLASNNSNINVAMDVRQEAPLIVETALSSIGLYSPLALPFELIETVPGEKSAIINVSRKQYRYEYNGVSITVMFDVYPSGSAPSEKEITESVSERLKHAPGLELVDLEYHHAVQLNRKPNRVTNLRIILHSAKYIMQPFAKEINYEVRNYIHYNQRWMITVSYKSCDVAGRTLTEKFLNTLSFI